MISRKTIIEKNFYIVAKNSEKVSFKQNFVQDKLDEVRDKLKREGKPVWIIILKARQEGMSSKICADWVADCVNPELKNLNCVIISHEKEATKRLLRRGHYYIDNSRVPITTQKSSEFEISFPKTNSWLYIGTSGSRAFGRGDTLHRVHLSELAYYESDTIVDGIFQSVPMNGEVIIESTANGFGNRFHKEWERAVQGESKFYPLFLAWFENPEYSIENTILTQSELTDEEKLLMKTHNLSIPQIAWRREKMKEFTTKEMFMQEYPATPEEAFIATGTPAFDVQAIKLYKPIEPRIGMLKDNGLEVVFEPNENGYWRIWESPIASQSYFGFLDPAEGIDETGKDSDYAAAEIFNENLEQVAELQKRLSPSESARQFALAGRYFNNAFLGFELNNSGHAVAVTLPDNYPKHQIYQEGEQFGWRSSQKTRKILVDGLGDMIPKHDIIIRSRWAISELFGFRLNSNGKYEAQKGAHDDLVIALGGVVQMYKHRPLKQMSAIKQALKDKKKQAKPNPYFNHD